MTPPSPRGQLIVDPRKLCCIRSPGGGATSKCIACSASTATVSALLDHLGARGLDKRPLGWQPLLDGALLLGGTLLVATL